LYYLEPFAHNPICCLSYVDASPSSAEKVLYHELSSQLVEPSQPLLRALERYQPSSDVIRNAIATPSVENENLAWEAVLPTVDMLREMYDYADHLRK
jgi:hypothetical protein